MDYVFKRSYCGAIKLAIFDWAGTVIDYGCCAPAAVFIEGFRRRRVKVTMSQAREPMGMEKRNHIRVLGEMPTIASQWEREFGQPMTEDSKVPVSM